MPDRESLRWQLFRRFVGFLGPWAWRIAVAAAFAGLFALWILLALAIDRIERWIGGLL